MHRRSVGWCLGLGLAVASPWGGSAAAMQGAMQGAGQAAPAASPAQPQIRAVVLLVVLDDVRPGKQAFSPAHVDEIEAALRRVYQVEVRRLESRPLPRSAFYAPRKRYRADDLLEYLGAQIPAGMPAGTRVLGLTT